MHVVFPAIGASVFLAVRDPHDLRPPTPGRAGARRRRRDLQPVPEDSDLTRVNRQPGRWVAVDPLLVAAVEIAVAAARRTHGWCTRCSAARSCSSATTATSACSVSTTTTRARPTTPLDSLAGDPRPPGRRTSYPRGHRARSGRHRQGLVRRPDRHGVRAAPALGGGERRRRRPHRRPDGRPWLVGVAEHPGRIPRRRSPSGPAPSPRRRRWSAAGPATAYVVITCSTPDRLPVPEVWRTVTAVAPTCVGANTAQHRRDRAGEAAPDWLATASGRGPARAPGRPDPPLGGWPVEEVAA